MINERILRPKAQNDLGRRIFFVTMLLAAITFLISLLVPLYSGIVQVVAIVFLCTSLFFYTRYVASVYSYEVSSDADGRTLFIVRQTAGTRSTTHCRMTLGALVRAETLEADAMALYRKNRRTGVRAAGRDTDAPEYLRPEADVAFYDYCVTFRPTRAMLLCFRSRGERADLLVEVSQEFAAYLQEIAANERAFLDQEEI